MRPEEIIEQMDTFTLEEKERINLLVAGEIKDISTDDMKLFSRWETSCALADVRFKAECEALQAKTQAEIEERQKVTQAAFANLEAQAQLAQARLKAVQDGKI